MNLADFFWHCHVGNKDLGTLWKTPCIESVFPFWPAFQTHDVSNGIHPLKKIPILTPMCLWNLSNSMVPIWHVDVPLLIYCDSNRFIKLALQSISIADTVNKILRTKYLRPNSPVTNGWNEPLRGIYKDSNSLTSRVIFLRCDHHSLWPPKNRCNPLPHVLAYWIAPHLLRLSARKELPHLQDRQYAPTPLKLLQMWWLGHPTWLCELYESGTQQRTNIHQMGWVNSTVC